MTITKPFSAACVQMNSSDDVANNQRRAADLIAEAAGGGADLVVLPEFFPLLSADETAKLAVGEADNDGPIQEFLASAAQQHGIYLVGGTIPIFADDKNFIYAACPFYAPDGARLARYDKIHLFRYTDGKRVYDETATIRAGERVVAVTTPLGRIGLSVCYDLRFPELYRAMEQPDIIVAPSAFVPSTGRAHWEILLRARAVENLAYVLAAAQAGEHGGGRRTHGDTMIVGAWGDIRARAQGDGEQCVIAELRADEQADCRRRLPALDNRCL